VVPHVVLHVVLDHHPYGVDEDIRRDQRARTLSWFYPVRDPRLTMPDRTREGSLLNRLPITCVAAFLMMDRPLLPLNEENAKRDGENADNFPLTRWTKRGRAWSDNPVRPLLCRVTSRGLEMTSEPLYLVTMAIASTARRR
jgi:hypothetical protein